MSREFFWRRSAEPEPKTTSKKLLSGLCRIIYTVTVPSSVRSVFALSDCVTAPMFSANSKHYRASSSSEDLTSVASQLLSFTETFSAFTTPVNKLDSKNGVLVSM